MPIRGWLLFARKTGESVVNCSVTCRTQSATAFCVGERSVVAAFSRSLYAWGRDLHGNALADGRSSVEWLSMFTALVRILLVILTDYLQSMQNDYELVYTPNVTGIYLCEINKRWSVNKMCLLGYLFREMLSFVHSAICRKLLSEFHHHSLYPLSFLNVIFSCTIYYTLSKICTCSFLVSNIIYD